MRKAIGKSCLVKQFILIQVISCCFTIDAVAQSLLLQTRITLHCTDKPLSAVLDEMQQNYRIRFSYFKNQIPLQQKISIDSKNEPLQTVLDKVMAHAGIQYQAIGGQIVLKNAFSLQARQAAKADNPADGIYTYEQKQEYVLVSNPERFSSYLAGNPSPSDRKNTQLTKNRAKKYKNAFTNRLSTSQYLHAEKPFSSRITGQSRFASGTAILPRLSNPCQIIPAEAKTYIPLFSSKDIPLVPLAPPVYTNRIMQVAFVPGISTHGIHPGEYINNFSLNIFAGYSAGNKVFELGGLSNFNQNHVSGFQMGGLANVVGGNRFVGLSKQEKQKLKKEHVEANLQGIQVAGVVNVITGNVFGWQTAGGINLVKESLQGIQVAGISNIVNSYSFGLQLAGISNASIESVDGVQVAGLYNYTAGELHGIQISAFNQAGNIEGKHSTISADYTGLQIGLLNTAKKMNGYQIGLINIGGKTAGTQIGLININSNSGKNRNGVPIGLLNINSKEEFVRLYTSELFVSNIEISTGSTKIQNMLSAGYNPVTGSNFYRPKWSIGYSVGKVQRPAKDFFYSYDAGVSHINQQGKFTRQLSLLSKMRATAGYRIHLRKVVFHVFGGLTFNAFVSRGDQLPVSPRPLRMYYQNWGRSQIEMWPGFVAGIHI